MFRHGLFLIALLWSSAATAMVCDIAFEVRVTHGIGPYPPGVDLHGTAQFETLRSFRQEGGATAHLATGTMGLEGNSSGRLWTLLTTSRTVAADLVGLYALDVEGLTFIGQEFRGPMALTIYGPPGSWPHERPPITQAEWDSLTLRRTFQLHAPNSSDMLGGDVTALTATCVDSDPAGQ